MRQARPIHFSGDTTATASNALVATEHTSLEEPSVFLGPVFSIVGMIVGFRAYALGQRVGDWLGLFVAVGTPQGLVIGGVIAYLGAALTWLEFTKPNRRAARNAKKENRALLEPKKTVQELFAQTGIPKWKLVVGTFAYLFGQVWAIEGFIYALALLLLASF